MRSILMASAGLLMMSGVAMAQGTTTQGTTATTPQGYSTNGPMTSSNGAAVAPNGGLQSGVGTTLANPSSAQSPKQAPIGNNGGGSTGGGGAGNGSTK
jgi:hypothetical protein